MIHSRQVNKIMDYHYYQLSSIVKMVVQVDKLCLLAHPQRELQVNLKTTNMKNCQKVKLHGSLTTKYLKKPHSSRQVGGTEIRNRQKGKETQCGAERQKWHQNEPSYIHVWWIKIRRNTLEMSIPSPKPVCSPGFQCQKINPHNFWLSKTVGVGVAEETAGVSGDFT